MSAPFDERQDLINKLAAWMHPYGECKETAESVTDAILALIDDRLRLERGDHKDPICQATQTLGMESDCGGEQRLLGLRAFGQYLTEKTSARAARLAGDIDKALQHEAMCEELYKRLPEGWKW